MRVCNVQCNLSTVNLGLCVSFCQGSLSSGKLKCVYLTVCMCIYHFIYMLSLLQKTRDFIRVVYLMGKVCMQYIRRINSEWCLWFCIQVKMYTLTQWPIRILYALTNEGGCHVYERFFCHFSLYLHSQQQTAKTKKSPDVLALTLIHIKLLPLSTAIHL